MLRKLQIRKMPWMDRKLINRETLSLVTELKSGEALVSLFGSNSIVKAKMHPSKALLNKD